MISSGTRPSWPFGICGTLRGLPEGSRNRAPMTGAAKGGFATSYAEWGGRPVSGLGSFEDIGLIAASGQEDIALRAPCQVFFSAKPLRSAEIALACPEV